MTTVPNITNSSIYARIVLQLPPWWGDKPFVDMPLEGTYTPTTFFNNIMWGYITTASIAYTQMQYCFNQTRIGIYELRNPNSGAPLAYGNNLDLISMDYYGNLLPRRPNEGDDNYRNRIFVNLISGKATRNAMTLALFNLTGFIPTIIEPWNSGDLGVLNWDMPPTIGLNSIGGLGSNAPYTCYITVYIFQGQGMQGYTGVSSLDVTVTWGVGIGDPSISPLTTPIDIPPMWLGDQNLLEGILVTPSDVENVINLTKVLGTICYYTIVYVPMP
jgi:hypothetical protein